VHRPAGSALTAPARAAPAADGRAVVEACALQRVYGHGRLAVPALVQASCTVGPRQRLAIVGPSGSGKSTLLQLLGGLDQPTAGTVSWPALGARGELRPGKVAFVFQQPSLLAPLNVAENVELPLLLGRTAPSAARQAALATLERLELGRLAEKLPEELSGGQAQQVALARALAGRPRLILADEPTGQLDRRTAERLLATLLTALDQIGAALILATHDPAVAGQLGQVWRIERGRLETGR
jgi:ABC-type lipoprotein export system ATPase subunit